MEFKFKGNPLSLKQQADRSLNEGEGLIMGGPPPPFLPYHSGELANVHKEVFK